MPAVPDDSAQVRRISSSGLPKSPGTYWSVAALTLGFMLIVGTVLIGPWAFIAGLVLVGVGVGGVFRVEYQAQRQEGFDRRDARRKARRMLWSILSRFASR